MPAVACGTALSLSSCAAIVPTMIAPAANPNHFFWVGVRLQPAKIAIGTTMSARIVQIREVSYERVGFVGAAFLLSGNLPPFSMNVLTCLLAAVAAKVLMSSLLAKPRPGSMPM